MRLLPRLAASAAALAAGAATFAVLPAGAAPANPAASALAPVPLVSYATQLYTESNANIGLVTLRKVWQDGSPASTYWVARGRAAWLVPAKQYAVQIRWWGEHSTTGVERVCSFTTDAAGKGACAGLPSIGQGTTRRRVELVRVGGRGNEVAHGTLRKNFRLDTSYRGENPNSTPWVAAMTWRRYSIESTNAWTFRNYWTGKAAISGFRPGTRMRYVIAAKQANGTETLVRVCTMTVKRNGTGQCFGKVTRRLPAAVSYEASVRLAGYGAGGWLIGGDLEPA